MAFWDRLTPVKKVKWTRARKAFFAEQAERGIELRDIQVPETLAAVKTIWIDGGLIMEGWNAVRMIAAPLAICLPDKFTKQGSWMLLTAAIAQGCDGYAPLNEFAKEMGFESGRMQRQYPRVDAVAYDDARRLESTVHKEAGGLRVYTKGDPEALLERCTQVLDGKERPMLEEDKRRTLEAAAEMEAVGLETLAFATRRLEEPGEYEAELTFLGMVGMGDLARENAPQELDRIRAAGVRPVMITETLPQAGAVLKSGVVRPEAKVFYGDDLDALDGAGLKEAVQGADAFLGIDASQRGRLLRALRAEGPVAVLESAENALILSTGRGDTSEATLLGADLSAVARLLEDCQALVAELSDEAL